MSRRPVQPDPEPRERKPALAARTPESPAQDGHREVLCVPDSEGREEAWNRFLAAAGSVHEKDTARDVSVRHDAYLADAFSSADALPRPDAGLVPKPRP